MHFEHTSVREEILNTRAKNNREVSFLPGSVASPHAFPSPFKSIFSISSGHSAPREEEKEKIEKRFKDLQTAYEVLTDPKKRREYDSVDAPPTKLPTKLDEEGADDGRGVARVEPELLGHRPQVGLARDHERVVGGERVAPV